MFSTLDMMLDRLDRKPHLDLVELALGHPGLLPDAPRLLHCSLRILAFPLQALILLLRLCTANILPLTEAQSLCRRMLV